MCHAQSYPRSLALARLSCGLCNGACSSQYGVVTRRVHPWWLQKCTLRFAIGCHALAPFFPPRLPALRAAVVYPPIAACRGCFVSAPDNFHFAPAYRARRAIGLPIVNIHFVFPLLLGPPVRFGCTACRLQNSCSSAALRRRVGLPDLRIASRLSHLGRAGISAPITRPCAYPAVFVGHCHLHVRCILPRSHCPGATRILADRAGFEPAGLTSGCFRGSCIKPLCHLSGLPVFPGCQHYVTRVGACGAPFLRRFFQFWRPQGWLATVLCHLWSRTRVVCSDEGAHPPITFL